MNYDFNAVFVVIFTQDSNGDRTEPSGPSSTATPSDQAPELSTTPVGPTGSENGYPPGPTSGPSETPEIPEESEENNDTSGNTSISYDNVLPPSCANRLTHVYFAYCIVLYIVCVLL